MRCSGRYDLLMVVLFSIGALCNVSYATETSNQSTGTNESNNTQTTTASAKYGWIVVGPNGAVARSVTSGSFAECPLIDLHNQKAPVTMIPRVSKALGMPKAFTEITVCEFLIPGNIKQVSIAGQKAIPLGSLHNQLTNVVVLGDTGCRGSQRCDHKSSTWEFPAIAEQAAKGPAELLLHVGDYHYREGFSETGCKGVVQDGDCWLSWELDFFHVASEKKLLSKAPWIFARGNHETCKTAENRKSRAWRGWFLLLDPRPLSDLLNPAVKGKDFPPEDLWSDDASPTCKSYTEPYEVDLQDRNVWVVDSSGLSSRDRGRNYIDFQPQFESINKSITGSSWILLHHPIWGTSSFGWLTTSLAHAWASADTKQLEKHVEMIFAGHIHLFEELTFKGLPTQFVFGGSGTSRDRTPRFPAQLPTKKFFGSPVQSFAYTRDFDYGVISQDSSHWNIVVENTATQTLNTCAKRGKTNPSNLCKFQVKKK